MKTRQIGNEHEADDIVAAVTRSAVRALAKLEALRSTAALNALWSMKTEPLGCDPLDADAPLNLIEQLNQTFTYIATARAVKQLLVLHPDLAPFTANLGTASGSDIVSTSGDGLAAEVFSAVNTRNNEKLAKDINKVAATSAAHKYVFFMCPGYGAGRHQRLERDGVQVWSIAADAT
jgi:hypothetical protein